MAVFYPRCDLLGAAGIAGYFLLSGENFVTALTLIDQTVPPTDLTLLGDTSRLTATSFAAGKITLVNFFACGACPAGPSMLS